MLENSVFSQPSSKAISDKYVAVKLLGGNDLDDEGKAFMSRYGVRGYPTMLGMSADGAVLQRNFERTADGIVKGMDGAAEAQKEFLAKEAELSKKTDDASVRELAGLYKDRFQFDQARSRLEKLLEKDPTVEDQMAMLDILAATGDKDARKALLETLVSTRADHKENINWRIALATADIPSSFSSREEYEAAMGDMKTALTGLLEKTEKPAEQAEVRVRLAQVLNGTREREAALEHWDWVLENARDCPAAAHALMGKANSMFRAAQGDAEKLAGIKAMLDEIIEKHASSPLAPQAKQALPYVQRAIDKAKEDAAAAAAEAKSDDDEGDEHKDGDKDEDGDHHDGGGDDDGK